MPRISQPSLKSLLIQMRFNGQPLAVGTGFIVYARGRPHLITNRHNVTGRHQETGQPLSPTGGVPNEILINHNALGLLGRWIKTIEPLFEGEIPRWKEHPILGALADFVALPLSVRNNVGIYPYDLSHPGPNILVAPGDVVSVIGFPFGLTGGGSLPVWATGFVASEPQINYSDLPIMLIDCRSRPGQSGSPVVAYRSGGSVAMDDGSAAVFNGPIFRFVGVYSGRINPESDIGRVWKAAAIAELIDTL